MFDLESAIRHCEKVAEREQCNGFDANTKNNYKTVQGERHYKCAEEHRQLAEWLNELKELREKANHSDASNSSELTTKQAAIDAIYNAFCYAYCDNCENSTKDDDSCEDCHRKYQNWRASKEVIERVINGLPSAEPEIKPISYTDCSNAMLKMWIDNVLTDGEYNKIMDKLNAKHRGEEDEIN